MTDRTVNHRRPVRETHALSYWRAVCAELRAMRAPPASLPECEPLRLAGYSPILAATVLS